MGTQASAPRRAGTRFFLFYLLVLGLMSLAMAVLGSWLLNLGGTPYDLLAGVVLMVAALLMGLGRRVGVLLFGALLAFTMVWVLYEVRLDGWALIPRLAWIGVLGLSVIAWALPQP